MNLDGIVFGDESVMVCGRRGVTWAPASREGGRNRAPALSHASLAFISQPGGTVMAKPSDIHGHSGAVLIVH